MKSFQSGIIQSKIKETRDKKLKLASQRKAVFVGTNQYPNTNEKLDPQQAASASTHESGDIEKLQPQNGAVEFEEIRNQTDAHAAQSGRRPKAYMVLLGNNPTMRTARSQFSAGFIGCGGFEIVDGTITETNEKAMELAIKQNAEITVICGADDDYATEGVTFAKKFKEAKKNGILVIAGYPTESLEDLKAAGVDAFIHIRADLIETLKSFQQKLNII